MISSSVCEGGCVCCLVVGASHSQERRKLAAADCEVLDCFSQQAGYNPSRTYTTTGRPPRRTQAGRLTTAKRVCSLADPAEPAYPTSTPRPGRAAQSGSMTLLRPTGAPVRAIRADGWRPRALCAAVMRGCCPKREAGCSTPNQTKAHYYVSHTSHTTLSLRGCMHLQARRSLPCRRLSCQGKKRWVGGRSTKAGLPTAGWLRSAALQIGPPSFPGER